METDALAWLDAKIEDLKFRISTLQAGEFETHKAFRARQKLLEEKLSTLTRQRNNGRLYGVLTA